MVCLLTLSQVCKLYPFVQSIQNTHCGAEAHSASYPWIQDILSPLLKRLGCEARSVQDNSAGIYTSTSQFAFMMLSLVKERDTFRPRHSSSGYSLASHRRGPGSIPGLVKWYLWWIMWRWGGFSQSTSVSAANLHSTIFSIIIITRCRVQ
jgi:hypothetical protein